MRTEIIEEIAKSEAGRTEELKALLEKFEVDMDSVRARGSVVDDLRSYLSQYLPEPSLSEVKLFGMMAARSMGLDVLGRQVAVVIMAYKGRLTKPPRKKKKPGGEGEPASERTPRFTRGDDCLE